MKAQKLAIGLALALSAAACNGIGYNGPGDGTASVPPDTSSADPSNPANPSAPPNYKTAVLLYNGSGVSTSDWQSTEAILKSKSISYQLANAAQLNAMTLDEISSFGAIVVPGGSGGTEAAGMTSATQLNLRKAVQQNGVGYVGFCAGAWIAVGPEAETTSIASYGLALAKGSVLSLFMPGGQNPTAAIVNVSFPDSTHRDLVWWGGPATPEWAKGVVARYDDGEPAISETFSGKGLVLVSGPHPEAPQGWRATAGNDPDGLDYDIAVELINAAINKKPLATF